MYFQDFGKTTSAMIKFIPIAWIMFSFRQFENILWGWQIQIYLCVLVFVASVYMLEKSERINYKFVIAVLSGAISSFSFFTGLLVWPVGFIFIALRRMRNRNKLLFLWIISSIIIYILYFYNWTRASPQSTLFIFKQPVEVIKYLFTVIGSPMTFDTNVAITIGVLTILLTIIVFIILIHHNSLLIKNAKWIALMSFSLFSTFAMAIGRSVGGVEQAMSSRYTTIIVLLYVGLYIIILNLCEFHTTVKDKRKYVFLKGFMVIIIISGILTGYVDGFKAGEDTYESRLNSYYYLLEYKSTSDNNLRTFLYPWGNVARERASILEKYNFSVFSDKNISNNYKSTPDWNSLKRMEGGIMVIDIVDNKLYSNEVDKVYVDKNINQYVGITGWAVDSLTKDGSINKYLVLENGDEMIVISTEKRLRPDVAKYFGVSSYKKSGWSATLRPKEFKNQCYNISLRILRANGEEYYELDGEKPICFS